MKFKIWCIEHGYTAKMVSEATGISVISIFSYWQGVRTPNENNQKILFEKLGVPREVFRKE